MENVGRRAVIYAAAVFVSYVLLEAASLLALHTLALVRPNFFADRFVDNHFDTITNQDRLEFLQNAHDPILGWDTRPLLEYEGTNSAGQTYAISYDTDGSRANKLPQKEILVNTYGDSFTLCDEVDDDQTWQFFLEQQIGFEVKNFGVGAYGTGQALLKMDKHISEGLIAPITVLAILDENIKRVVNSFRPLYHPSTGVKLGFKPSFRFYEDAVVMTPNPYSSPDLTLEELRTLAHEVVNQDYWKSVRPIEIRYPYVFQIARAVVFIASRKFSAFDNSKLKLWDSREGHAVMNHMVDNFSRLSEKANSVPILLFIPSGGTLARDSLPRYSTFVNELRKRHKELIILDLFEHEFERGRFNVRLFAGHASEYGNEVIADVIGTAIREVVNRKEAKTFDRLGRVEATAVP